MQRQIIDSYLLDNELESRCSCIPQPGMKEFAFSFVVMPLRQYDGSGCNWEVVFSTLPGSFRREIEEVIILAKKTFNLSVKTRPAEADEQQGAVKPCPT